MIMTTRWQAALIVAGALVSAVCVAAEAARGAFGALADGRRIEVVTLRNRNGMAVRIITLGATIQSLFVPDRRGHSADVVLGFSTAQEYFANRNYFGATVGRFANRIAGGQFSIDGRAYHLAKNDGANHLHGGNQGFDKAVWSIDSMSSGANATTVMSYVSPDGEESYPGTLHVVATFSLDEHNALRIEYRATTDQPTIVNISNHSYFRLSSEAGAGSALDDILQLSASRYTPVDSQLVPSGELRDVTGTPFDFRKPTLIGLRVRDASDPQIRYGRGYDHNFVLDGAGGELHRAARLFDPPSGRVLEIATSAPGLQFYSGNFLDGTVVGKADRLYRQGDGLAFEPQVFPDAPNHQNFPSARLDPGGSYVNRIVYRFSSQ